MKHICRTGSGIAGLILRVGLGLVIFPHGAQKLLGWFGGSGFSGTIEHFSGLGIPVFLGVTVIVTEFFGSLMLLAGFLTRVWALGIAVLMSVAVAMVHWHNGFFMNWYGQQQGEGFEYHILAFTIAIALLVGGGGAASIDRRIASDADDGSASFAR